MWANVECDSLLRMQEVYGKALDAFVKIPQCRCPPYLPPAECLGAIAASLISSMYGVESTATASCDGVLDALRRLICEIIDVRNEQPFQPVLCWCLLFAASHADGGMLSLAESLSQTPAAAAWLADALPSLVQTLCTQPGAEPIAETLRDDSGDPMVRLCAPLSYLYSPLNRGPPLPRAPPQEEGSIMEIPEETSSAAMCRICHSAHGEKVSPCACTGSMRFVHVECIHQWLARCPGRAASCEICRHPYPQALVQDLVRAAAPSSDGSASQEAAAILWQYEVCEAVMLASLEEDRTRQRNALQARIRMRQRGQ